MRIVVLTQFYPPEPDPKMHVLARGLVARGHQVTVLTGFPNWPTGRIYPGFRQRPWLVRRVEGVRVVRLPLYPDHSRSGARRAATYLSLGAAVTLMGPFLSGPADIVFVYHPPPTLGIPGLVIKTLRRARFVYEVQDLWPDTLPATGFVQSAAILGVLGAYCRTLYRRADAISVHAPSQKALLAGRGVPSGKIHFIPNWAYESDVVSAPADPALGARLGFTGRFHIVYAGNIGPAQGLGNLLEAAALVDDPGIQFVLAGDGIEREALEGAAKSRGIGNVRFVGRLPQGEMAGLYALADVLLVHLRDDPLFEMTIPGKTQSYMAAGRPILASVGGDGARLVLDAGAGLTTRPSDPRDLARGVREMRALSQERLRTMGESGRRYYLENLTPEVLIPRYEAMMQQVLHAA